jgi:hypothetical protein
MQRMKWARRIRSVVCKRMNKGGETEAAGASQSGKLEGGSRSDFVECWKRTMKLAVAVRIRNEREYCIKVDSASATNKSGVNANNFDRGTRFPVDSIDERTVRSTSTNGCRIAGTSSVDSFQMRTVKSDGPLACER